MNTPLEILHKYFHHFNSERTRNLVVRAMEDYAKIYHETEVKKLRQPPVSGLLPPDKLEKSLGSTNRQFIIWHDGGEWLISLKGKEHEQCKTLKEWIGGNDR